MTLPPAFWLPEGDGFRATRSDARTGLQSLIVEKR